MNARQAAVGALVAVTADGRSLSAAIAARREQVATKERALFQELCYGVVRHFWSLSSAAEHLLDKPLAKKHADVRALLLLGLYQLSHMRTPPHAAVMETVAVADELRKGWSKGLVNAVLRSYQRRRAEVDVLVDAGEEAHHDHPAWLIYRLRSAWGERADTLLAAGNEPPPMTLRVNGQRSSRAAYLARLANEGIDAHAAALADSGVYLESPRDVDAIPGFREGIVSVQDEAAQLAAPLLSLRAGQRVLDACAAPGGKSGHILETEPGLTEFVALDVDSSRLSLVAQNHARLGLKETVLLGDAGRPSDWWDGRPFDRILLDAPCSGTGVIRRNPDIKLLRKEEDIAKLAGQQRGLLDVLWPLLRPGGILVYATCSVLPEENWLNVADFLRRTPDAAERPIEDRWGEAVEVGRQLLPGSGANDGFYYSRLEKV